MVCNESYTRYDFSYNHACNILNSFLLPQYTQTHADAAKVQVGFGKVSYLWPCFSGDTFTKTFTVESIRNTSDGHNSVSNDLCDRFLVLTLSVDVSFMMC